MEGISVTVYKNLRGYWKRKGYVKLNSSTGARRSRVVNLGSTRRRRRRLWRMRVKAKLRILPSPKKLFVWLRDAYVKMMQGLDNSGVVVNTAYGGDIGGGGGGGWNIATFGKRPVKEYDDKMIVDVYKSLAMVQGQLLPREARKLCSAIICQR
ncbi:F5K24.2-like protein [Hibiscus syriacus]|uniref:F5K24.2-like protein n=1 Tax=Hibiscus syriacus TaxID=106335 RepID=A0A6A2YSB2_HIBSY|nr:F5K24.2-like protein [Hibiscus syriacus]